MTTNQTLKTGAALALAAVLSLAAQLLHAESGTDVTAQFFGYRPYQELARDDEFNKQFNEYMEQLYNFNVPDAVLVFGMMKNNERTLNALEVILHEKVELRGWMELGHSFKNIMDTDYYRTHYTDVYPVAHRQAVKAEYGLVKYFAMTKGFGDVPAYAYALVSPLAELHEVSVDRLVRMLRYNPEITTEIVTLADLETAVKVYEAGGYTYKDKAKIIAEARAVIKQ